MAEKRMFSKKITESDAFLDMPLSTQCLYFHLSMSGDDDGFVNNPKRIMRAIGATDDDLKLLIAKSFVLAFENGVIVIKHWRINNTLQNDRYKPTDYKEEFKMLGLKPNKSYTWIQNGNKLDTECIQDGYSLDTQHNITKHNITKHNITKHNKTKHRLDNSAPSVSTRFVKPTLDEVIDYCNERGNSINAEQFFDYYESNGWKVGKSSMKDWKATIRNWERREKKENPRTSNPFLQMLEEENSNESNRNH